MKKNKKYLVIVIILLCIGSASITTTLILNERTLIGSNSQDYQIFFSEAIVDNVDKSNTIITENKQTINFSTKRLTDLNEKTILDYEVTNNSREYDASVQVICQATNDDILSYVDIIYNDEEKIIPARSRARGTIEIVLKKVQTEEITYENSFTCEVRTNALEREDVGTGEITSRTYYTYGFLVEDTHPLTNQQVIIYDDDKQIITNTDGRGMFIVDNLQSGEYDVYILDRTTDINNKTKDEIASIAYNKGYFDTKSSSITFADLEVYSRVNSGTPVIHDVTFDTNGGTAENIVSKIIEDEPIGYLPSSEHETLIFSEWTNNDIKVEENQKFTDNITLIANYSEAVARIDTKYFATLNQAFEYVKTAEEKTIDVIKDNKLIESIVNEKKVILNLNAKNVDFGSYGILNHDTLTINSGNIIAKGSHVFINEGILNITDNVVIDHEDNDSVDAKVMTIASMKGELSISNSTINTSIENLNKSNYALYCASKCTIDNIDIDIKNALIYNHDGADLTIKNSRIEHMNNLTNHRTISTYGKLTIDNNIITNSSENTMSNGLLTAYTDSEVTILSGTFDNTYGQGSAIIQDTNSTMTLGSMGKSIKIIGGKNNAYAITSSGLFTIDSGNIIVENQSFINVKGTLLIGSDSKIPTINCNQSGIYLNSNQVSTINNANLTTSGAYGIIVNQDSKVLINNGVFTHTPGSENSRFMTVYGNATINDGNFSLGTSEYGAQLFVLLAKGEINLHGGTLDYTNGITNIIGQNADSILNIGGQDKTLNFIFNSSNKYIISSGGNVNIIDGIINVENGPFMYSSGQLTIGSTIATPTINANNSMEIFTIVSNNENIIHNAKMNVVGGKVINVRSSSRITIENCHLNYNGNEKQRAFYTAGTLTINGGNYVVNSKNTLGLGLITGASSSTVNINQGTFDNTHGTSNSVYMNSNSTLNIGEYNKNIEFIGNSTGSYIVASLGTLNIPAGNITSSKGIFLLTQGNSLIGNQTTKPIINIESLLYGISIKGTNNKIINAHITNHGGTLINADQNSELTIEKAHLIHSSTSSDTSAISSSGKVVVNDTTLEIANTNIIPTALINVKETGEFTINSGLFDGTYSKGNSITVMENGRLIIGKKDKTIELRQRQNTDYPTIAINGEAEIKDGTINSTGSMLFGVVGKITIGSESTKPIINGQHTSTMLTLASNNALESRIINAELNEDYGQYIYIQRGKLIIDNCDIIDTSVVTQTAAIQSYDQFIINNINIQANSRGNYIMVKAGTTDINGGNFSFTNLKGNPIFVFEGATLNIGQNMINPINMYGIIYGLISLIANTGNLNIYNGNIEVDDIAIIQDKMPNGSSCTGKMNIYGGMIKSNSSNPTVQIKGGSLIMTGGSVINDGSGYTLENYNGEVKQTGGISANNYDVTTE